MVKTQKSTTSPPPPPPPEELKKTGQWSAPWDQTISLDRRLLIARTKLRGTKLWKTFQMQRDFEAFSIHVMANPLEEILNELGITSHFEPTSWTKNGNVTVVQGAIHLTEVDTGEVKEIACYGEAVDNGDKGMGKAYSAARKNGMIAAFNLGIGHDIEDGQEKAEPAHQQSSGSNRPEPPPAEPPAPQEPQRTSTETYNLQQVGKQAIAVLHTDMVQRVTILVSQIHTSKDLQAFVALNTPSFDAFFRNDAEKGAVLQQILQSRFKIVKEKEAA